MERVRVVGVIIKLNKVCLWEGGCVGVSCPQTCGSHKERRKKNEVSPRRQRVLLCLLFLDLATVADGNLL